MIDRPTADTIAKVAYGAYGAATDRKNFHGEPMPSWDELPTAIRTAWMLAAEAVRHRVEISL